MSEVIQAFPYVKHLRLTKRAMRYQVPTDYVNKVTGEPVLENVQDLPGIMVSIVLYTNTGIEGPEVPYSFPSKSFLQSQLDIVKAKEPSNTQLISHLESILADATIIWTETILQAGGLGELNELFTDIFNDGLNEFTKWKDSNRGTGGVPVILKELQWDIRTPWLSSHVIDLNFGSFLTEDQILSSKIHSVTFIDDATNTSRNSTIQDLIADTARIQGLIDALPPGESTQRTQYESELANKQRDLDRLQSTEVGLISTLMSKPSVQASYGALVYSIIAVLKQVHWPTLDMNVVQEKMEAIFAGY